MALGDYAVYVAVLATIGWEPLAVTTNLNVNFLRKPGRKDLLAHCDRRVGKHGHRRSRSGRQEGTGRRPFDLDHSVPPRR